VARDREPDGNDTMERMRPQVVAHRGASDDLAEHTLAAYLAAMEAGAEAFECDVRLTADGHLVCVHDRNLWRTASKRRARQVSSPRMWRADAELMRSPVNKTMPLFCSAAKPANVSA